KKNDTVLKKMGKKYMRQHEVNKAEAMYKVPDMFRLEGKLGLVKVQMINTGNKRIFRVPSLRITKREDISKELYRKQTCLDIGLLCESAWVDFNAKYIKTDQLSTGPAYLIDFVRKWENPKTFRTWIDKKTLRILRIEKKDPTGKIEAIFVFPEAKNIGGVVWAPTRVELRAPNGEIAGITQLINMKVNSGLSDKLFQ
ncbi:MAG: outer membrane lipoprotein-sorting protein, partial [Lentisphaerae bacterium]|nr:outer membrane lipoprotein-sorting protein [Lentisphaerota bacterium]